MDEKEFERIVKFRPPFDERRSEPKKNYGIGSLRIWFILKKDNKAVQVMISTNSYLASVIEEYRGKFPDMLLEQNDYEGYSCWDVGYHSPEPVFEGHTESKCDILDYGICYYDGSSLRGKELDIAKLFIEKGDEAIWKFLKKEWKQVFGGDNNG